jgi:selenocysteine lyase/cysteine desulfurase
MDWQVWRKQFPITEHRLHLNHAGVSPVSRRVVEAVRKFIAEAAVVDAAAQRRWEARSEQIRASFAHLIGADADEIAFVKNTSEGLSLIAAGLDWQAGDNVIALQDEYPSNVYPWFGLRRWGVETRLAQPRQQCVRVEDLQPLVDRRTRVVALSFVDWSTGARTDLGAIGEWCRDRGILFCVDGIQGVGAMRIDVKKALIDCMAVGGHKWLLAPEGCGCLFVSRRVNERVQSVLHGWKSVVDADTYLPYHFEPRPDAAKFEPGSPSQLGAEALGAAIDLLLEIGTDRIEARLLQLTDRLAAGLRSRGAEIISPWDDSRRSGILVFRCGDDSRRLCNALLHDGIIVRVRGGGVRVAPHFYNNEEDMDRVLAAVDRFAGR